MMFIDTDHADNKCINCTFWDERNSFCRRYPPTSVVVNRNNRELVISVYPVIQKPELDHCGEFNKKVN